jgi:hypothetical protein
VDYGKCARPKNPCKEENSGSKNCQNIEAYRRCDTPKGFQPGFVLGLTHLSSRKRNKVLKGRPRGGLSIFILFSFADWTELNSFCKKQKGRLAAALRKLTDPAPLVTHARRPRFSQKVGIFSCDLTSAS